jgi:uncharacterized protein (DUF58 family)
MAAASTGGTWVARQWRRAADWERRRRGGNRLPMLVSNRRVYILPTRAGLAFAALLLVMLLAGLNYSNSMAMLFTFMLAGFGLIAMHLCHRNLVGTMVRGAGTVNAFAGEHGRLLLTLENAADTARFALECSIEGHEDAEILVDLTADGTGRADIAVPLERRGRLVIERIKLSTAFPFGLFRAWTWVHVPVALLAWPVPRGRADPPAEISSGGNAPAVHQGGDDQWAGLREFREGDSPRQVAWSVFARGGGLLVKTYESPVAHHRTFDLARTHGGDLEARLEQVSAWIVAAHARGESYGLRLDGRELAPDSGNEHRERCLNALALYGTGEPW